VDLADKTAVITGAAGGIGLGIARACLGRRMRIVVSDLDAARLAETAAALRDDGGSVLDVAADVRSPADVEALRVAALEEFGRVDLVCNNAGVGLARPVLDCADADWDLLLDVNVRGVVNGIRTFLPVLIEQGEGHINSTSSMAGLISSRMMGAYNVSKHGVVALMAALERELRDAVGGRLYSGTSDIQKNIIALELGL